MTLPFNKFNSSRRQRREDENMLRKASIHAERYGCFRCRKPIQVDGGVTYTIKIGTAPGAAVIHGACLQSGNTVIALGTTIELKDPYVEADRLWFQDHPVRNHRIRETSQEELNLMLNRKRLSDARRQLSWPVGVNYPGRWKRGMMGLAFRL